MIFDSMGSWRKRYGEGDGEEGSWGKRKSSKRRRKKDGAEEGRQLPTVKFRVQFYGGVS